MRLKSEEKLEDAYDKYIDENFSILEIKDGCYPTFEDWIDDVIQDAVELEELQELYA